MEVQYCFIGLNVNENSTGT